MSEVAYVLEQAHTAFGGTDPSLTFETAFIYEGVKVPTVLARLGFAGIHIGVVNLLAVLLVSALGLGVDRVDYAVSIKGQ